MGDGEDGIEVATGGGRVGVEGCVDPGGTGCAIEDSKSAKSSASSAAIGTLSVVERFVSGRSLCS